LCLTAGVEDVIADSISRKVVVKGKKAAANPMKVVEYVQKKTGHKVELISPIPPPLEEKKEEEKKEETEPPKPEEEVIEITLIRPSCKIFLHCPLQLYILVFFILIFLRKRLISECFLVYLYGF
jgi:hypothetical protein